MDNYNSLEEEKVPDDLIKENIIRRNKKKISQSSELPGKSMLKKSDLSLVFLGAGIITLIIFFVFLRPSSDVKEEAGDPESPPIAETVKSLEQKMTTLEEMLQAINASANMENDASKSQMPDIKPYVARIERVETALSVKFDVLTARVDKMDDKLSDIIRDVEKNRKVVSNIRQMANTQTSNKPESTVVKTTPQTKSSPETKSVSRQTSKSPEQQSRQHVANKSETSTKTTLTTKTAAASKGTESHQSKQQKAVGQSGTDYHTVVKGDTLYSISKKYNTTVDQLRAMNKMTIQDAIIIGQRIVVKK